MSKEINRFVDQKLIVPVEKSEWSTLIVLMVKEGNGKIRLCGDYKITLNTFLEVDTQYPKLII